MTPGRRSAALEALDETEATLLDLVDNLLDRGVVLTGEVTLGLAGVDLVYLRLSVLLAAADRVADVVGGAMPLASPPPTGRGQPGRAQ